MEDFFLCLTRRKRQNFFRIFQVHTFLYYFVVIFLLSAENFFSFPFQGLSVLLSFYQLWYNPWPKINTHEIFTHIISSHTHTQFYFMVIIKKNKLEFERERKIEGAKKLPQRYLFSLHITLSIFISAPAMSFSW